MKIWMDIEYIECISHVKMDCFSVFQAVQQNQGCRFVPRKTFLETIKATDGTVVNLHIAFQGLALIQAQIYNPETTSFKKTHSSTFFAFQAAVPAEPEVDQVEIWCQH